VPSRPLQVVHLGGRPRVERLDHLEAHRAPILHRGHPPAILGPTEDPQALGLPVLCIQDLLDGADPVTLVKDPASALANQGAPREVPVLGDPLALDSQAMGILHMEDHHRCMGIEGRQDRKDHQGPARLDLDNIDLRLGPDPNAKCPLAGVRCTTSPRSLWSAPSLCSIGGKG